MSQLKCYRVCMKDGYAGLYDAESESEARKQAIRWAEQSIQSISMSARDKRQAITVDYSECLSGN